MHQPVSHDGEAAVETAKVAMFPIVNSQEAITESHDRLHPGLVFVVLDHGRHGLVLRHHGAHVAAEATVAAARRALVHHDGALRVRGGAAVDVEQILVVDAPRVWGLDDVLPNVVTRPSLDGQIHPHSRKLGIFVAAQALPGAVLVGIHHLVANLALSAPLTEDQDRLAVRFGQILDELGGRADLEAVGAPAEFVARGWVALADQIHPKAVLKRGREAVRLEGQTLSQCSYVHLTE